MDCNDIVKKILLLMIIIFSVSCCGSLKNTKLNNGAASFANVKDSVFFILRSDFIDTPDGRMQLSRSSGTGTSIYSNKNYSDILTAGHVCVDYFFNLPDMEYNWQVFDFDGNERSADLISVDVESDLCLLRIYAKSRPITISDSEIHSGMYVRYSGYPMGIYMPGTLHHFSGYHSGTDNGGLSMYSLAVTGGSSGSAILNSDGEIIGVISSVTEDFAHLVISPGLERIKTFIYLSSTCEKFCIQP